MSDYKPRKRKCWMCEGRGRVRNNTSANGCYVFGSIACNECEGMGYFLSKQRLANKPA